MNAAKNGTATGGCPGCAISGEAARAWCAACFGVQVHPHIIATGGRPGSVEHFLCHASPADSHNMVPKRNVPTCTYCGQTMSQLAAVYGIRIDR